MKKEIQNQEEVTIQRWVKRGSMMVNAEALDFSDPEHLYNQILSQGKRPEDYGVFHPYREEFEDNTRDELIEKIIELRKEVESLYRVSSMW